MIKCNGKSQVHDLIDINNDRVFCKQCKHQFILRRDLLTNAPEKRQYAELFRRLILQPKDPLFFKIYPQYLKI